MSYLGTGMSLVTDFHILCGVWQVWLPKGVASQTHVDKGQSMPRKLRHVAGLRGAPRTQMTVLNLELDLGQPYQL